ncbi:hypothetical protein GA252_05305 [Staphylococcus pseudintermedius]|nr:hypothetical protein [Staphylococcus pseudintermedius]
MKFNQKFTIGEKVKITDIDNYKDYTGYYDVPELQDEYLSNTVFTITDAEIRDLVDSPEELEDASEDVYQYELVDDKGHTLDLMIDSYALEKAEMFNKMKKYPEYANMAIVEHYYTHSLFDTVVFASESLEDAFEYLYQQNLEDDYSVLEVDNFGNATYLVL